MRPLVLKHGTTTRLRLLRQCEIKRKKPHSWYKLCCQGSSLCLISACAAPTTRYTRTWQRAWPPIRFSSSTNTAGHFFLLFLCPFFSFSPPRPFFSPFFFSCREYTRASSLSLSFPIMSSSFSACVSRQERQAAVHCFLFLFLNGRACGRLHRVFVRETREVFTSYAGGCPMPYAKMLRHICTAYTATRALRHVRYWHTAECYGAP